MSEGHIRQRGPGSWELKYDIGRDPVTGRRIIKYATVRGTKRDAQRELRARLNAVDKGVHADAGKMTFADWLNEWLAGAAHTVSPTTHEVYSIIVTRHLAPAFGELLLSKLTPMHIQAYYTRALASGRLDGKGGLSPQTVRHHDRLLNVALKRARALRLIATNPVEDVTCPKVERKEIEILDDDEALRLITAVRPTRLYAPIFLALATGLRRGELLGLRWSDVNLDRSELTVTHSLEQTKAGLRLKEPKTKSGRRKIALSGTIVDVLRQHKIACLQERIALGLGNNPKAFVFGRPDNGEAQSPCNFSKAFSRIAARAGLGHITLHALRHTHITNLLREGVHPKIASERAGHSSISVTLDIYSHAVPGLQEDAAARIDGALAKLVES